MSGVELFAAGLCLLLASLLSYTLMRLEAVTRSYKIAVKECQYANTYLQEVLDQIDAISKTEGPPETVLKGIAYRLDQTRCKSCGSPAGSRYIPDFLKANTINDMVCPKCAAKRSKV